MKLWSPHKRGYCCLVSPLSCFIESVTRERHGIRTLDPEDGLGNHLYVNSREGSGPSRDLEQLCTEHGGRRGGVLEGLVLGTRGKVGKGALLPKKDVLLTGERGRGRMLGKEKQRTTSVYACL